MQTKKIPMRKCCGCFEKKPKRELIRIVKTPDGSVLLDLKGKVSGRGAYICSSAECLNKARKSGRIEKALETEISKDLYIEMERELTEN